MMDPLLQVSWIPTESMPTGSDRCKAACRDSNLMEDATQGLCSLYSMVVPSSRESMGWDRWIPFFLTGQQQGSPRSQLVTVDDVRSPTYLPTYLALRFSPYPRSLPSLKPPKIMTTGLRLPLSAPPP